jgi:hypothetical protein
MAAHPLEMEFSSSFDAGEMTRTFRKDKIPILLEALFLLKGHRSQRLPVPSDSLDMH